MKLLSCHIDNFGKLSDQDFVFEDGVNVILRENGWGKSTLANYILVMFYGFDEKEGEREKYRPWQGGTYGGTVTFESGAKTLFVRRVFGEAEEEDVSVLTDLESGREFPIDFNLGVKLFSIDRASFKRTVFMGQNDNPSTGASGDITNKISGLTDNLSEIGSYEEATGKLENALYGKGPDSAMGKTAALREEVRRLTVELDALEDTSSELNEKEAALTEARNEEYEARRSQEELIRTQSETIMLRETALKQEEYRRLKEEQNRAGSRYEEIEKRFPNGVPEKEELDTALDALKKQLRNATGNSSVALTTKEEEELAGLEARFTDPDISAAAVLSIARAENLNEKRAQLEEKRQIYATLPEEDPKKKKKNGPIRLIIDIIVIVVGLDIAFFGYFFNQVLLYVGGAVAAIGLILLIIDLIRLNISKKNQEEETVPDRAAIRLEAENDAAAIKDEEEALAAFLESHDIPVEKGKEEEAARELFRQVNLMEELRAQETTAAEEEEKAKAAITETVDGFLDRYGFPHTENPLSQIFEIQNDMERLELAKEDLERADHTVKDFEENNNVARIMAQDTSNIPGLEGLQEAQEAADQRIQEAAAREKTLEQSIQRLSGDLLEKDELEKELSYTSEVLNKEEAHSLLLAKTQMYLAAAREAQSAKYLAPLKDGFAYYYSLMGSGAESYVIDENAGVRAVEFGEEREAESLSTGTRDLIGLSLRLSLVDAMYTGEKPFLVMDDPFVNFDLKKTSEARKFLDKVGEKYQIIYFTCHESRA